MTLARVVTALLALVACAWFVLGFEQAHSIERAAAIINSPHQLTRAQARTASSLLVTAGTLNPDTQVDILRARLAQAENQPARAVGILARVTRREPMNVSAWVALAASTARGPLFARAIVKIAYLVRTAPHVGP